MNQPEKRFMNKFWRSAFLFICVSSMALMLGWTGFLAYRWYEGYAVGKLMLLDITANDHPGNSAQGAQQRMAAWQSFAARQEEIANKYAMLNAWQREVAVTHAFDGWKSNPRPGFGTYHFWKLLFSLQADDCMERMLDVPLPAPRISLNDGHGLVAVLERLMDESHLPLWFANHDRTIAAERYQPEPGRSFRRDLDEVTSRNGLSWRRIDQLIAIGSEQELAELQHRVGRGRERVALLRDSQSPSARLIAEKLSDPVTLEFVGTPLDEVLDFLRDYTGVNIVLLDRPTAEIHANNPLNERPIDIHVQDVSLRVALDCTFLPAGLDWVVIDEILAVGRPEELAKFSEQSRAKQSDGEPSR